MPKEELAVTLIILVVSVIAVLGLSFEISGAVVLPSVKIKGALSDRDGRPLPVSPLYVYNADGGKIGEGWSRSTEYELTLIPNWQRFELLIIASDYATCAVVPSEDVVSMVKGNVANFDLECEIKCVKENNKYYCEPALRREEGIEFSA